MVFGWLPQEEGTHNKKRERENVDFFLRWEKSIKPRKRKSTDNTVVATQEQK